MSAVVLDYRTKNVQLFVVRDVESQQLVGTWPAEGPNAPVDAYRSIADALAQDPYLCTRQLRVTKEEHLVCMETGALLT